MVALRGLAVSYERGTPADPRPYQRRTLQQNSEAGSSKDHQQPDLNYPGSRKGRFPLNGDPHRVTVQGKLMEGSTGVNSSRLVAGGCQHRPRCRGVLGASQHPPSRGGGGAPTCLLEKPVEKQS